MAKVKVAFLIILAVVLAAFAIENTQTQSIKLFKYPMVELPAYLLAFICLALGLVVGWSAHALRTRRKRQEAAAAAASEQQQQEPQKS